MRPYQGLVVVSEPQTLRTGHIYRRKRGRGSSRVTEHHTMTVNRSLGSPGLMHAIASAHTTFPSLTSSRTIADSKNARSTAGVVRARVSIAQ
jgi:hypothetical protein